MISGSRQFIFTLAILSAVLLLIGLLLLKPAFPEWYFPFLPWLVLIFLLVNSVFIIFFFRFLRRSNQEFIRGFMVSTAIKLLIYFMLILAYVLTSPKSAIPFAVAVSILYITYTAFDLFVMLSLLKRRKENKPISNHLSN
jgi:uncharacterized membrane protein YozB (DUF420 family)